MTQVPGDIMLAKSARSYALAPPTQPIQRQEGRNREVGRNVASGVPEMVASQPTSADALHDDGAKGKQGEDKQRVMCCDVGCFNASLASNRLLPLRQRCLAKWYNRSF